jgi:hypothetical protein
MGDGANFLPFLIPRKYRKFRKFAVSPSLGLTD